MELWSDNHFMFLDWLGLLVCNVVLILYHDFWKCNGQLIMQDIKRGSTDIGSLFYICHYTRTGGQGWCVMWSGVWMILQCFFSFCIRIKLKTNLDRRKKLEPLCCLLSVFSAVWVVYKWRAGSQIWDGWVLFFLWTQSRLLAFLWTLRFCFGQRNPFFWDKSLKMIG